MFRVSASGAPAARGFTLVEALVAVVIASVMLAVGVPMMSRLMQTSKAQNAVEFYNDALVLTRRVAMGNRSRSRLTLSDNTATGQYDWQVDICFLEAGTCAETSNEWSTETTPAPGDPLKTAGYKSIKRSAESLMSSDLLVIKLGTTGEDTLYLRPDGWVDPAVPAQMVSMEFTPKKATKDIQPAALKVSLMGVTTRCDPSVVLVPPATDPRACPP